MTFIHAPTQEMTDDSSAKISYIPLECRTMVYLGKTININCFHVIGTFQTQ